MNKVSILIPNYNYGNYIYKTIESCINQTYQYIEIIVLDDGSTDSSRKEIERASINFPGKIKPIFLDRVGLNKALNIGIKISTGSLICIVHSDDLLLKNKIAAQVEQFDKDPEVSLSHTEFQCIDEKDAVLPSGSAEHAQPADGHCLEKILQTKVDVRSMTVMFKKKVLMDAGGFREDRRAEDWQLILLMSSLGKIGHINEILVLRRIHQNNWSIRFHRDEKSSQFDPTEACIDIIKQICPASLSASMIVSKNCRIAMSQAIAHGNFKIIPTAFKFIKSEIGTLPGVVLTAKGVLSGIYSLFVILLMNILPSKIFYSLRGLIKGVKK